VSEGYPEFEDDAAFFADEVTDVEGMAAADNTGPNVVTRRFFDESGNPRTEPTADSSAELWDRWLAEQPEPGPEPAGTDETPLSELEWQHDYMQRSQAIAEVQAELDTDERLKYVAARAREFGVRDPEALQRVDASVQAAAAYVYRDLLARGFTVQQAQQEIASYDYDPAIDRALADEHYFKVTENTKVGAWRRQQEEQRAERERLGLPRQKSFYDSPSIQKMARGLEAYARRQEERREWFRSRGWA
jgi:hypothetical protein